MTPQFALSLSFDGIRLLHNAQGGWRVLGDVALDNPNLAAAMQALADLARQTGQDTDIYCKVILPDAQIKYLCLPPSDTPQDAARAALTGTTPYPVNALAIDTVQTQDHLFVAATARETLHEADAFLRGHGFTPSHFAGVPPADLFPKEPYFDGPPPLFIASGDPAAARQRPSDTPEKTPDETPDQTPSDTPDETAVTPADGGPMPPHQPDLFPADTPPAAPATPTPIPPQAKPPAPRRLGSLIVLVVGLGLAGLAAASLGSGLLRLLAPHSTAKAPDPALPPETLTTQPPTQAPSAAPLQAPSQAPSAAPPPQDPLYANPKAFYRRHGISIAPPLQSKAPAPGTLDRLYLTSIDPISIQLDAIALPNPAGYTTDSAPAPVPSPPSPRTRFSFDQDGLVIPQKDGALSPDGYTVYAGKPWVVPPPPPVRFETNPIADLERQRLSATRPRLRPDSLSENNQRAALGGLTRDELSQLRPRLRPQSAQETALAAQPPGAAATPLALVPRPPLRPNTLAAPQSPQPQPQASAPNIPSSASISRQATRKNALALGRINLIGIYGKSSDRRALVRLANGRYVKVEVGDSLDGGRILAISETELRYQKSGRNHVLKMPKG